LLNSGHESRADRGRSLRSDARDRRGWPRRRVRGLRSRDGTARGIEDAQAGLRERSHPARAVRSRSDDCEQAAKPARMRRSIHGHDLLCDGSSSWLDARRKASRAGPDVDPRCRTHRNRALRRPCGGPRSRHRPSRCQTGQRLSLDGTRRLAVHEADRFRPLEGARSARPDERTRNLGHSHLYVARAASLAPRRRRTRRHLVARRSAPRGRHRRSTLSRGHCARARSSDRHWPPTHRSPAQPRAGDDHRALSLEAARRPLCLRP
jgi:hypothetical protein